MQRLISLLVALVAALFSTLARLKTRQVIGFTCALLVGSLFLFAIASNADAGNYGQQLVFSPQQQVLQYQVVPQFQRVVVPQQYAIVQQQNAACAVQALNNYSAVQAVRVVQPQKVRSVQRIRGGGRQRSLSIQSSSSGGGFLRNILPF